MGDQPENWRARTQEPLRLNAYIYFEQRSEREQAELERNAAEEKQKKRKEWSKEIEGMRSYR